MRTWTRARLTLACGNCGTFIEKGEPLLALTLTCDTGAGPVTLTKVRCVACEGPAPTDLATAEVTAETDTKQQALDTLTRLRKLMPQLPVDYKAMSAGDREPGEDD